MNEMADKEGNRIMSTVTLEEAQARLANLIDQLQPGEEIVITRDQKPVARLVAEAKPERKPRRPGTLKGSVLYMAPDFNAPLDDFKEYME
jgi:prevent-host-death family protein